MESSYSGKIFHDLEAVSFYTLKAVSMGFAGALTRYIAFFKEFE